MYFCKIDSVWESYLNLLCTRQPIKSYPAALLAQASIIKYTECLQLVVVSSVGCQVCITTENEVNILKSCSALVTTRLHPAKISYTHALFIMQLFDVAKSVAEKQNIKQYFPNIVQVLQAHNGFVVFRHFVVKMVHIIASGFNNNCLLNVVATLILFF